MKMTKLVLIGMLLGGSMQAFANASSGGDTYASKLVQIQSRAAIINDEFPSLRLRVRENIPTEDIADRTLQDLLDLDVVLHDDSLVPAHRLINLACGKAVCGQE